MRTGVQARTKSSVVVPIHGLTVILLAVVSSYFAYLWGSVAVNPAEVLAPFLFWYGVAFLLLAYPLRPALAVFTRNVKTVFGTLVFGGYLVIHVFLYGFLLEGILDSFGGRALLSSAGGVSVTTTVFAPPSALNAALALWYNPWITLTVPPVLSTALSLYSIVIAVVIAILIVANIGRTRELGEACPPGTRSRSMVLFPALGIALGASCCLSVPLLVTLAVPTAAALSSLLWVYDATYYLFPPFAVAVLYLNLYSVQKITANLKARMQGEGASAALATGSAPTNH